MVILSSYIDASIPYTGSPVAIPDEKSVATVRNIGFASDGATVSRDRAEACALTSLMRTFERDLTRKSVSPSRNHSSGHQGSFATVEDSLPSLPVSSRPRSGRSSRCTSQLDCLSHPLPFFSDAHGYGPRFAYLPCCTLTWPPCLPFSPTIGRSQTQDGYSGSPLINSLPVVFPGKYRPTLSHVAPERHTFDRSTNPSSFPICPPPHCTVNPLPLHSSFDFLLHSFGRCHTPTPPRKFTCHTYDGRQAFAPSARFPPPHPG